MDLLLGKHVYEGGGFVKEDQFRLSQDGATDTDELAFSRAEVHSTFVDVLVETFFFMLQNLIEVCLFKKSKEVSICELVLWIKVEPERSSEKGWILRNDSDSFSQFNKWHSRDVNTIN